MNSRQAPPERAQQASGSHPSPAVRKPYTTPQVSILGRLTELTTGGSVNKHENNGHPTGLP